MTDLDELADRLIKWSEMDELAFELATEAAIGNLTDVMVPHAEAVLRIQHLRALYREDPRRGNRPGGVADFARDFHNMKEALGCLRVLCYTIRKGPDYKPKEYNT